MVGESRLGRLSRTGHTEFSKYRGWPQCRHKKLGILGKTLVDWPPLQDLGQGTKKDPRSELAS